MRIMPLLLLVAIAACARERAPTIIDGSSQQAFDETMRAAKGDVGPSDRVKLETALAEFKARMFARADNRQDYQRLVRQGLDGLTAPRIVAQFDKDVDRVKNQTADAVFDAKRTIDGR